MSKEDDSICVCIIIYLLFEEMNILLVYVMYMFILLNG